MRTCDNEIPFQDGSSFNDVLNTATGAVLVKDKAVVLIVDGSERIFEFDSGLSEDVALQKVGVAGIPVHSDRVLLVSAQN